jgi:hypothetical protein
MLQASEDAETEIGFEPMSLGVVRFPLDAVAVELSEAGVIVSI